MAEFVTATAKVLAALEFSFNVPPLTVVVPE